MHARRTVCALGFFVDPLDLEVDGALAGGADELELALVLGVRRVRVWRWLLRVHRDTAWHITIHPTFNKNYSSGYRTRVPQVIVISTVNYGVELQYQFNSIIVCDRSS